MLSPSPAQRLVVAQRRRGWVEVPRIEVEQGASVARRRSWIRRGRGRRDVGGGEGRWRGQGRVLNLSLRRLIRRRRGGAEGA